MKIETMYYSYYENSLMHKAVGTCQYELSKIKRLLKLFDSLGLYDTADFDKNALNALILALKSKCSNKTINKLVLITKQAFKFNNIDFDYLQSFKKLKEGKRHFDFIAYEDLKKIMNYISNLDSTIDNNLLYQSMTTLMLDTGMRANELMNIEIKHINFDESNILLTTTKTKKERYVFFTRLSEPYLKKLVNQKPKRKLLLYNFLKERTACDRDLKWLIIKLKNELKIEKLHPHMFRHTFATLAYNHGIDIFVLQQLLGHENIATTQIYTHISKNKLQAAYKSTFNQVAEKLKLDD